MNTKNNMTKEELITKYTKRVERKNGKEFAEDNEELIEILAMNKRVLDRIYSEIENLEYISDFVKGSMKQTKEEVSPLVDKYATFAKLVADNLDALQLTPRAKFKKLDAKPPKDDDNDPTAEYFNALSS